MEVDAQGYGREPTAMVRGVLSCLFVCLFVPNPSTFLKLVAKWGYGLMKKYACLDGLKLNKRRLSDAFWNYMDKDTISKAVEGEWNAYLESGPEVSE